jgi:hypothetical protein
MIAASDVERVFSARGQWRLSSLDGNKLIVQLSFERGDDKLPVVTHVYIYKTAHDLFLYDNVDPDSGYEIVYRKVGS